MHSYDAQGRMTQFTDSARNYTATVTADANGNITRVEEAWTGAPNNWRTDFAFDYENRLTQVQGSTVVGGTVYTWNTVSHSYDGLGRRLKTTAGGVNYAHIYDGMKLAGNRNLGTSTDGTAWVNAVNDARPLASLSIATTGATRYYSVSDERDPVRRTYTSGGTAGDTSQQSHYGENVGAVRELPDRAQHAAPLHFNGAAPVFTFFGPRGTKQSEVFPVRSLTVTENDVALPAERGNLEYAGLALVYEGNRVKSALLGRDLNPLGRGDGGFYFSGAVKFSAVSAGSLRSWNVMVGTGNSVNNPGQTGGGYTPIGPPSDGSSSSLQLELASDWEKRTGKKPVNSSIWDSPPGGGLPHLIIGATCCPALSACCMTTDASGNYMPYTRCFPGPTAPCDDPSACGAPPVTPGANGGGGGRGGGSTGGDGCSGCGGGGGPMSWQGGCGGSGPTSFQGGGGGGTQGAPPPPLLPPPPSRFVGCSDAQQKGMEDAMEMAIQCVLKMMNAPGDIFTRARWGCIAYMLYATRYLCQQDGKRLCCPLAFWSCCSDQYATNCLDGTVLLCSGTFSGKAGAYTSAWCNKIDTLIHEAIHSCGVEWGDDPRHPGAPYQWPRDAIACCMPECLKH